MENTPEKKLLKFTKKLLDEFKEYLPLAVIYKLNVICCQSQNMRNREILNFLKNDIKIPSNYADTDTASCDEILAKYQKEDQHKLLRLKRCDSIPKLLQEIGYANFINAVIKKYPSPSIVGFPRKNWTAQCVLKYIRLYSARLKRREKYTEKAKNRPYMCGIMRKGRRRSPKIRLYRAQATLYRFPWIRENLRQIRFFR